MPPRAAYLPSSAGRGDERDALADLKVNHRLGASAGLDWCLGWVGLVPRLGWIGASAGLAWCLGWVGGGGIARRVGRSGGFARRLGSWRDGGSGLAGTDHHAAPPPGAVAPDAVAPCSWRQHSHPHHRPRLPPIPALTRLLVTTSMLHRCRGNSINAPSMSLPAAAGIRRQAVRCITGLTRPASRTFSAEELRPLRAGQG
jgi:hypothetical protein